MNYCPLFYFYNFFNWKFGWSPDLLVHVCWSKDCCRPIFFFFLSILLIFFFFFFCLDAPWRGVALAQGLAGLTPGPALHKIDSCFYLCHKIQDLIGNWMIPNLRFLRKSMILHNLLLDYHRVPSPYKDNIKTGDEIQDYISLIQPVVKVVVVGI